MERDTPRRLLIMGSKDLGLKTLSLVHRAFPENLAGMITIDDRKDGRSVYEEIIAEGRRLNVPVWTAANKAAADALVEEARPDCVLVVYWYLLIGAETLAKAKGGFLGLHNSLLPHYRGGAPLVWAILNGEAEAGVSLFKFTEGMDDGDVWDRRKVTLGPDDYIGPVLEAVTASSLEMLRDALPGILSGRARAVPQRHSEATYCGQRLPEDGNIDWSGSALSIYAFIRAQSDPYPGAFTRFAGGNLTVWRAHPDPRTFHGTPGQVLLIGKEGVHIACGDGRALILEEVERNGIRGPAAAVLTSVKIRLGGIR